MRSFYALSIIFLILFVEAKAPPTFAVAMPDENSGTVYAFINGNWFDGRRFQPQTFYSVHGILTRTRPAVIDQVLDLANGFVVPPFGEAHNHNVNGPWDVDEVMQRYLKDGVFYVKIPGDIGEFTDQIRQKINLPNSIDVIFSHGGLTGTGGHPISLYEDILRQARYEPVLGPLERGWFNNRGYFIIDTEADLLAKWNTIMAGKPDFIKTYLIGSEPNDSKRDHASVHTRKGLDPALLPRIVPLAHREGLRVSVHVETANDFHHAVMAGVDEINHLPGWRISTPQAAENARLSDEDAGEPPARARSSSLLPFRAIPCRGSVIIRRMAMSAPAPRITRRAPATRPSLRHVKFRSRTYVCSIDMTSRSPSEATTPTPR
ncbi:MAG TPA: hypothetical protein VJ692_14535 [Nitrospiraceae bacterium]|nr:hypothetical protein [Nitrospiraceae bacterium]